MFSERKFCLNEFIFITDRRNNVEEYTNDLKFLDSIFFNISIFKKIITINEINFHVIFSSFKKCKKQPIPSSNFMVSTS